MPRQAPIGPLCVVNVGFHFELLLPMKKGLQLMELLQSSVLVRPDYGGSRGRDLVYEAHGVPEVNCSTVRADQIRKPLEAAKTLRFNPSETLL